MALGGVAKRTQGRPCPVGQAQPWAVIKQAPGEHQYITFPDSTMSPSVLSVSSVVKNLRVSASSRIVYLLAPFISPRRTPMESIPGPLRAAARTAPVHHRDATAHHLPPGSAPRRAAEIARRSARRLFLPRSRSDRGHAPCAD